MIAHISPEIRLGQELQPQKRYVLDIGIGIGGSYLSRDRAHNIFRIGLDINPTALETCQRNYGSPNLVLQQVDVCVVPGQRLPFADQQFDQIDIFFPHYSGLYALISGTTILWAEMHRILKPGGFVNVISDFDRESHARVLKSASRRVHLEYPEINMAKAAQEATFDVIVASLTPDEAKNRVMTHFSKVLSKYERHGGSQIYHLLAKRRS